MSKHYTSIVLLCSILFLFACQNESSKKVTVAKPNVVFILVDDLGWKDVGCFGSDFYQTPNVDKLAKAGMSFSNGYASCTVCSPTRASIMSGKYPARINCTDWIEGHKEPLAKLNVPDWTMYMDTAELTLGEVFQQNGYATAHVGKWHLGEDSIYWPENQGFDINIGGWAKGMPNRNKKLGSNGYFAPYGNPRLNDLPEDDYLTERLADEACRFIEEKKDEPFFLNFWLYNVHTPLQAKEDKINKFKAIVDSTKQQKNPVYAAMVEHMDDAIGRIISQLEQSGVIDKTIIVFSSDNGGLIGNKQKPVTNNYPLRKGKGHMYEGGVRVPNIIVAPGVTKGGSVCQTPMVSMDYYPTLAELAGLELPAKEKEELDGVSLIPLLKGGQSVDREAIYWHYPHYHTQGARPYSAVRKGDWKLLRFFETDDYELYNLKKDISEENNLMLSNPEKAEELKKILFKWYSQVGAQFPTENPKYDSKKWNINK
jgi:arylsulfatase A-like enzyme